MSMKVHLLGVLVIAQLLGVALGYGGRITSHSMSGNTITIRLYDYTKWGSSGYSNRSCGWYNFFDSYSDFSSGCTLRISNKYVYITLDPWANINKGYVMHFDSYVCYGCTYTLPRNLTVGEISVEMDHHPFGLIPYVNLAGPYFNITPKLYNQIGSGRTLRNTTYSLKLPAGASVQLYSPDWIESDTKYLLRITKTINTGAERNFDFDFYTKPRNLTITAGTQCGPRLPFTFGAPIFYDTSANIKNKVDGGYYNCSSFFFSESTLFRLGPDCKLEPAGNNQIYLYPGNDHPLEDLDYIEFLHTFARRKVSFSYTQISTAHLKPIDHRLIFSNVGNTPKLEFTLYSNSSTYCGFTPTYSIKSITAPASCEKNHTSSVSGRKFTISNICSPILINFPYIIKVSAKIGPNTYDEMTLNFYSQTQRAIDHTSPIYKQKTGAINLLFSEPITHPNTTNENWDCNDFFFSPQMIEYLGAGCRMHRENQSVREIELILGAETTLKKGDMITFRDSFCLGCKVQITQNVSQISLITDNTTLVWGPTQNCYKITVKLDPLNAGETFDLTYWFYEPPTCTDWKKTKITKESNILTLLDLCESTFPYKIAIKRTTPRNFYREIIQNFITKSSEQTTAAVKYQKSGMIWAVFDGDATYPTPSSTPNEWNCSDWFVESSTLVLGAGCKIKIYPTNPDKNREIEIHLGSDTTVGNGTIIFFKSSVCSACNLTLKQEQPELTLQLLGLPLAQENHVHQISGTVKDYCNFYEPSKLYGVDPNPRVEACVNVTFTHEIIPPTCCSSPTKEVIQVNATYIQLNLTDPESSEYFYKFKLRMTLGNGFYREKEFKFYTQPIQEIIPSGGILLHEEGHFELEFTQEFENLPLTDLSKVFDADTVTAIGNGSITTKSGSEGYVKVLDITLGSNTTLNVGDKLVFNDSFCPGCTFTLPRTPVFNCTGIQANILSRETTHAITCSIEHLKIGETPKYIFADESTDSTECPLQFWLSGTFNETITINKDSLCLKKVYKLKLEFDSPTFKKVKYLEFTTFSTKLEANYEFSATFSGEGIINFPDSTNTTWNCSNYWFKSGSLAKLGIGCLVRKISVSLIHIRPGPKTTLVEGDQVSFSDSFCKNCNFISTSLPALALTYDTLPYWDPKVNHSIIATAVNNTQGTPLFTYNVTKPANCTKEITLPQQPQVVILAADLCHLLQFYTVIVKMDIGDFHRIKEFKFNTFRDKESK